MVEEAVRSQKLGRKLGRADDPPVAELKAQSSASSYPEYEV